MTARAEGASKRVRIAAFLLIAALVAGPVARHLCWMLGGTWGLYTNGVRENAARRDNPRSVRTRTATRNPA